MEALELAQPQHLAWLLLLPLLYFMSRPPRPRRTRMTAHLTQWLQAQKRLGRRLVRFRWLRFLLLVVAFLAVVVAHSEPRFAGTDGPRNLVILLDTSASTGARINARTSGDPDQAKAVGSGSVFTSLRQEILAVLDAVPRHVDVRLGLCGEVLDVVRGTRAELRQRLARITPGGAGGVDVARVATELAGDPDLQVWTLTDGLGKTSPPTLGALTLRGAEAPNLAITGCTVQDSWPLPEVTVRLRIANFTGTGQSVRISLEGGIKKPVHRLEKLGADESRELDIQVQRGTGGLLRVAIAGLADDALRLDDSIDIDLPGPPRPEIVVRSDGPAGRGLTEAALTLAEECGGVVVDDGAAVTRAGFLFMAGGVLPEEPRGVRMLSFGTAAGAGLAKIHEPRTIDWDRNHPITAGLDLSELTVQRALSLPHDPAAEVLIRDEQGPLAVFVRDGATARVHVAFRLEDSNLFKLAAFPQFVRRCFKSSYGREARVQIAPTALRDGAESKLARAAWGGVGAATDRPLAAFAEPPTGLVVQLLILALLCVAVRIWV